MLFAFNVSLLDSAMRSNSKTVEVIISLQNWLGFDSMVYGWPLLFLHASSKSAWNWRRAQESKSSSKSKAKSESQASQSQSLDKVKVKSAHQTNIPFPLSLPFNEMKRGGVMELDNDNNKKRNHYWKTRRKSVSWIVTVVWVRNVECDVVNILDIGLSLLLRKENYQQDQTLRFFARTHKRSVK